MSGNKKKSAVIFTVLAAVLLVVGIALDVTVYGFLSNVLNFRFGSAASSTITDEEKAERREYALGVAADIAEEGFVLIENNGTLPLASAGSVDLLGSVAAAPVYGGQGSSETSDDSDPVDYRDAFESAGFTVNADMLQYYRDNGYITEGVFGVGQTDFEVKDPDPDLYWNMTDADADLAVVVLGRSGGEDNDLPMSMESDNAADANKHTLEPSANERELLEKAAATYDNVLVVINSANPMELGFLDDLCTTETGGKGNIDACIWVGMPGYHGLPALADIVLGNISPSGRLTDTYAYDALSSAVASGLMTEVGNNGNHYTNLLVEGAGSAFSGYDGAATYMEYAEGIYVGYRYYETAAEMEYIDFDTVVQYPFGYGMSYAEFTWEIDESGTEIPSSPNGESSFNVKVNVTNESEIAARDTVQLYLTLDKGELTAGRLDRSAVTLVAYAKTPVIEPHDTESVTLTFSAEDMASYDDKGLYFVNGSYVIEAGEYTLALRTDSHTDKADGLTRTFSVERPIVYAEESSVADADTSVTKRPTDLVTAVNLMGSYDDSILSGTAYGMGIEYLGLDSGAEKWAHGTGRKGARTAPDSLVSFIADGANMSITNKGYKDMSSYDGTVGADGSLSVTDFGDTPYGDESWQKLVEQLPMSEMTNLILYGGYMTSAAPSVGKEATTDSDGPCGIAFIFRQGEFPGVSYPCYTVVAATWNPSVAYAFGDAVSLESESYGLTGWYAPGANIHRTPFGGRNFEYCSEDPLITGICAANTAAAATKNGTPTYMKHYALNEQESNRGNNLLTWTTEQAAREIYLRAFELVVKADTKYGLEYSPLGVMTSFNYVGDRWAGASYQLCTGYLRTEWGFEGTVVTDYFGNSAYMSAACAIRAGNDMMLGTIAMSLGDTSSGDTVYYMQQAAKNILYTYSRSWNVQTGMNVSSGMQPWEIIALIVNIVWWIGTAVLAFVAVRGWLRLRKNGDKNDKNTSSAV